MPELIEDEDVIFSKDSNYIKQKNKEKKNPIFERILVTIMANWAEGTLKIRGRKENIESALR